MGLGEGLGSGVNGAGIKVGMGQKKKQGLRVQVEKKSLQMGKSPTGCRVVRW